MAGMLIIGGLACLILLTWVTSSAIGRIGARLEAIEMLLREALFPVSRTNFGDSHASRALETLQTIQSDIQSMNARDEALRGERAEWAGEVDV